MSITLVSVEVKGFEVVAKVDKSERRYRIMAATLLVFQARGLENMTVADIAEMAGIAKGAVYMYFKSKDDLYMSLLDFAFGELFEEYATHPDIEDPVEQMEHVFLEGLAEYEHHELEFKFFIAYLGMSLGTSRGEEIEKKLRDSFRRNRTTIEEIYHRGVAEGVFVSMPPHQVSTSLMALSEFIPMQWVVDPKAFPLRETGKAAIEIFMRGIIKG